MKLATNTRSQPSTWFDTRNPPTQLVAFSPLFRKGSREYCQKEKRQVLHLSYQSRWEESNKRTWWVHHVLGTDVSNYMQLPRPPDQRSPMRQLFFSTHLHKNSRLRPTRCIWALLTSQWEIWCFCILRGFSHAWKP